MNVLGKGHRVCGNVQLSVYGNVQNKYQKGLQDATNLAKHSMSKHVLPTSSPKNNEQKSKLKTN